MLEQAFRTGRLLLPTEAPAQAAEAAREVSVAMDIGVVLSVVLFLILLGSILELIPYLLDSFLRARGSYSLENSVRLSRNRAIIAMYMLLPGLLVVYRYGLYRPGFFSGLSPLGQLLATAGAIGLFLLLRLLIYWILMPRRGRDSYKLSHNAVYGIFILVMTVVLLTVGLMSLFGASPDTVGKAVTVELALGYLSVLFRRMQILSLSCNHLQSFLYLCGLEMLPFAGLLLSAVLL